MVSVGIGPEVSEERSASVSDHSQLDSISSSLSSPSVTSDGRISEGQWLISRSEGQVAGLAVDNSE